MTRGLSLALALLLAGPLLLSGCRKVIVKKTLTHSQTLKKGEALEIELGNARIEVLASSTNQLTLNGQVKVAAPSESEADDLLRKTVLRFARSGIGLRITSSTKGESGLSKQISFRLTIGLPASSPLKITVKNGRLRVQNLKANLQLATKNGKISIANISANRIELSTKNGAIDAQLGRLMAGKHQMGTKNGAITLRLDKTSSVTLSATTGNGKVLSSFPITSNGASKMIRLGSGTATVVLKTGNGSIDVR